MRSLAHWIGSLVCSSLRLEYFQRQLAKQRSLGGHSVVIGAQPACGPTDDLLGHGGVQVDAQPTEAVDRRAAD